MLAALAQTTRLKEADGRLAIDADEAIQWLDDATSNSPNFVTLQGGYEKFEAWAEVDKFALPKTLFSEGDIYEDAIAEDLSQQTDQKLNIKHRQHRPSFSSVDSYLSPSTPLSAGSIRSGSPLSPPTSPPKAANTRSAHHETLKQGLHTSSEDVTTEQIADSSEIPLGLRPLFNYILWRIHQELDPLAALETFIFLSDDHNKRKYAQRFGIRTKSLSEIRYAIAREGREVRNRQLVQKKEAASKPSAAKESPSAVTPLTVSNIQSLDGAVHAPMSKGVTNGDTVNQENSDDDEVVLKRVPKAPAAMMGSKSPKFQDKVMDPNQFSRNPVGLARGSMRGASRGGLGRGGLRGGFVGKAVTRDDGSGPIDPDSFARPAPKGPRIRGGGRLWMPT